MLGFQGNYVKLEKFRKNLLQFLLLLLASPDVFNNVHLRYAQNFYFFWLLCFVFWNILIEHVTFFLPEHETSSRNKIVFELIAYSFSPSSGSLLKVVDKKKIEAQQTFQKLFAWKCFFINIWEVSKVKFNFSGTRLNWRQSKNSEAFQLFLKIVYEKFLAKNMLFLQGCPQPYILFNFYSLFRGIKFKAG